MKPLFGFMKPEKGGASNGDNSIPGIQLSQTGTTAHNNAPAVLNPDETKLVDANEVKLVEVKKTSVQTMLLRTGAVFIGRVLHYTMSIFCLIVCCDGITSSKNCLISNIRQLKIQIER
jgi:hypothetical protein